MVHVLLQNPHMTLRFPTPCPWLGCPLALFPCNSYYVAAPLTIFMNQRFAASLSQSFHPGVQPRVCPGVYPTMYQGVYPGVQPRVCPGVYQGIHATSTPQGSSLCQLEPAGACPASGIPHDTSRSSSPSPSTSSSPSTSISSPSISTSLSSPSTGTSASLIQGFSHSLRLSLGCCPCWPCKTPLLTPSPLATEGLAWLLGACGALLFCWGSWHQLVCHRILVRRR